MNANEIFQWLYASSSGLEVSQLFDLNQAKSRLRELYDARGLDRLIEHLDESQQSRVVLALTGWSCKRVESTAAEQGE